MVEATIQPALEVALTDAMPARGKFRDWRAVAGADETLQSDDGKADATCDFFDGDYTIGCVMHCDASLYRTTHQGTKWKSF